MTPITPEVAPLWMREPIKMLGWVATSVTAAVALILELVVSVSDLVPEEAKGYVQTTIAIATAVSVGGTRIIAILGRARVYSPATVEGQPPNDTGDEPPFPE